MPNERLYFGFFADTRSTWKAMADFTQEHFDDLDVLTRWIRCRFIEIQRIDEEFVNIVGGGDVLLQASIIVDEEARLRKKTRNKAASAIAGHNVYGDAILVVLDEEHRCYPFKMRK